jgi:hypothetical protein
LKKPTDPKHYQLGLQLIRNAHCRIWAFSDVVKRGFQLFEYDPNLEIQNPRAYGAKKPTEYRGGWRPILQYIKGKWKKVGDVPWRSECQSYRKAALGFHQTFIDLDEFFAWVGEEEHKKLIVDIL